jgi:hypothetical protein
MANVDIQLRPPGGKPGDKTPMKFNLRCSRATRPDPAASGGALIANNENEIIDCRLAYPQKVITSRFETPCQHATVTGESIFQGAPAECKG